MTYGTGKDLEKTHITTQRFDLFSESNPACSQTLNGTRVLLRCHVIFGGNWAPVMVWSQDNATHSVADLDVVDQTIRNDSVTSTLTLSMDQIKHSQYTCTTKFIASMKPTSTNASNVPEYTFTWTSEKINDHGKMWWRVKLIPDKLIFSSRIQNHESALGITHWISQS